MEHLQSGWQDRRAPTLKDVAREVGVSEAAASVVLNGAKSGTRVSPERRQAVVEAAARIGYRPNSVARALQAGHNHRLGLYSGHSGIDARNVFFAEILGGMCDAAQSCGSNIVIHTSGAAPERLVELVSGAALDGLVIHASHDDPIIPLLEGLRAPAVAVADAVLGLPSVVVDDAEGGRRQAEHLAGRGHRHVLYQATRFPHGSVLARMEAFLSTAKALGMRTSVRYEETFARPLDASDLAVALGGEDRATAIVGWSDNLATRVCEVLEAEGVVIPQGVAVVGFDGFLSPSAPRHDLTTVRAPWAKVGAVAVERLVALARGERVPLLTTLPVALSIGKTS